MKQTFSGSRMENFYSRLQNNESRFTHFEKRSPVHVVYGGAHLFKAETPRKLGKIALKSLETFAPNFAAFARAMWLKGADALPQFGDIIAEQESAFLADEEKSKSQNYNAWFAQTIYRRTIDKLTREPVEDFRIDFEDGYGIRPDSEEDSHAISASEELARAFREKTVTPFCGFRIKSFAPETYRRAIRTLDLFLTNFLEKTGGELPENFVVTLPKITRPDEVEVLGDLLAEFEKQANLASGAIEIEIMVETPQAIVNEKGEINLRKFVEAGKGRVNSAHFGAYDYTASFGISGAHQHLQHEACNFARQMMQISLAPLNIRLSDSVTTEMPVALYKNENLSKEQKRENFHAVHNAWRRHFNNVTNSLVNGFYQSWDLHPAQLPARYAAVFSFFLEAKDEQAKRLKGFIEKATRAMTTGNQFDDAASAHGLLNFFARALSSGALSGEEILAATGLDSEKFNRSFEEIIRDRQK